MKSKLWAIGSIAITAVGTAVNILALKGWLSHAIPIAFLVILGVAFWAASSDRWIWKDRP